MNTCVAVASMVALGIGAGCTPSSPRTSPPAEVTKTLVCHRAGEGAPTTGRATPELRRKPGRLATRPPRTRPTDPGNLLMEVAARMPRHDGAVHRQLATVIHDEATRAGLDPLLVLALIHVESSFDPDAVSYAGAVGLMQLRERTLKQEIEQSGLPPADPLDPVANVRAGIRYLRRLVRAFGGTDLALMAYNAGPNRILSYHRAGEIPERFHAYPRRIRGEVERIRLAIDGRSRKQARDQLADSRAGPPRSAIASRRF